MASLQISAFSTTLRGAGIGKVFGAAGGHIDPCVAMDRDWRRGRGLDQEHKDRRRVELGESFAPVVGQLKTQRVRKEYRHPRIGNRRGPSTDVCRGANPVAPLWSR